MRKDPDPGHLTLAEFGRLVLDQHEQRQLPYPPCLKQNGPDSNLLVLDFHRIAHADAWAAYFGAEHRQPENHPSLAVRSVIYNIPGYLGWDLQISGRQRMGVAP